MTASDRRREDRVPVAMRVDIDNPPQPLGFAYAENISVSGMRLTIEVLIPPAQVPEIGECLRLKFMLPGSNRALSLSAVVLRHIEPELFQTATGLAVSFAELEPEDQRALLNYVLTKKNKPARAED